MSHADEASNAKRRRERLKKIKPLAQKSAAVETLQRISQQRIFKETAPHAFDEGLLGGEGIKHQETVPRCMLGRAKAGE